MIHVVRRLPASVQKVLLVASIIGLGAGLFFLLT